MDWASIGLLRFALVFRRRSGTKDHSLLVRIQNAILVVKYAAAYLRFRVVKLRYRNFELVVKIRVRVGTVIFILI